METIYFTKVEKLENGNFVYSHHSITGNVISTDDEDTVCKSKYEDGTHFYAPYQESFTTIRALAGKMLTLLDASIDDKNKLKAMKDCVRGYVSEAHCQNFDTHYPRPIEIDFDTTLGEEISEYELNEMTCG